jgi:hypothetical protein
MISFYINSWCVRGRLVANRGVFGVGTRSRTFGGETSGVDMDEYAAMLDDAARGLANDVFQRQFLVRQWFKGYVN